MNTLDSFLKNLSKHELAIFTGFRYLDFSEKSREKITHEIKCRNLTKEELESLRDKKLLSNTNDKKEVRTCVRCGSSRLFVESDYNEIPIGEYGSAEVAIDSYRCRLCGFNAHKKPPRNFIERLKRLFKKHCSQRFIKLNSI